MATVKAVYGFDVAPHGTRFSTQAVVRGDGDPGEAHGACPLDGRTTVNSAALVSGGPGSAQTNVWSTSLTEGWVRFKVKFTTLPTDGDGYTVIWEARGSSLANYLVHLTVDSSGQLKAWTYSGSGTPTSLGDSGATVLSAGTWYTVHVFCRFNQISSQPAPNPPYQSDGRLEVFLDGTNVISYNPGGGDVSYRYGINSWATVYYYQFRVGMTQSSTTYYTLGSSSDRAGYIDSVCAYESSPYSSADVLTGSVVSITPIGVDTDYLGWGITTSNDELVCQDHPCDGTTDYYSSTTALDEVAFDLPAMSDVGVGGTVRFVSISILAGTSFQGELVMYVDGTEVEAVTVNVGSNQWYNARFSNTFDPATETLTIGVRKDNSSTARYFVRLLAEIECSEYTQPTVSAVVDTAYGSYTGNDGQQEINCGFKPSWVWVFPVVSSGNGLMKHRTSTGYPTYVWGPYEGNGTKGIYFSRFTSTGFVVRGTSSDTNASGVDYVYIAVRDEAQRVMKYGSWRMWSGLDDENITLDDTGDYAGFTPELSLTQACSRNNTLLNCWLRGPGHTGDQANSWQASSAGAYAQADYIQSHASDVLQVGGGQYITNIEWLSYFAIRDTAFSTTELWQVFTYVGDGGASKVVPLPAAWAAVTPTFALVQAAAYPSAALPGYYRVSGSAAGYSKSMPTGTYAAVGITAFGTGTLTVDGNLNASGVTYNVWVITTGSDTPSTPTDAEFPPTPGSIPPWDVDWPDDTPGLLGVKFSIIAYDPGAVPLDPWAYPVQCEQRQFPVDTQDFEINAPCEQRQFDALLGDEQRE